MTCSWHKEWENRIPVKIDGSTVLTPLENVVLPLIISDSSGVNNADLSGVFDATENTASVIFSDNFSTGGGNWYDANGTSYYDDGYLKHVANGSETYTKEAFVVERCEVVFKMKQHGRGSGHDQLFVYPFRSIIHDGADRSLRIYMRTYNSGDNHVSVEVVSPGWTYVYYTNHTYNYYHEVGNWFWVRLNRDNDRVSFRIWKEGTVEPEDWYWQGDIHASHNLTTYAKFGVDTNLTNTAGTGLDDVTILSTSPPTLKMEVVTAEGVVCPSELSYYNAHQKTFIIWAKLPKVNALQETKLFLYYDAIHTPIDNSEEVWSTDFVAVYHMCAASAGAGTLLLDSSPNEINGILTGGLMFKDTVPGILGYALDFNGSSDYVKVNNVYSKIKESDSTITIYVVFKFDESDGSPSPMYGDVIFSFNHGDYTYSNENSLLVRIPRDETYVELILIDKTNTEILHLRGTSNVCDQSWHCVVATYNNDTQYGVFYVDGVPEASGTATESWPLNDSGFASIAQEYDYWGATDFFNGKIDEVHIRNTAVNSSWVSVTTSGVFDNLFWYEDTETIPGFVAEYKNIWVTDDYIFQCVVSGVHVYDVDAVPLGFIEVCYRPSSVWASDDTLYIGTTVSGILKHPITSISGGIYTDLIVYKQYPEITHNGVYYIHGTDDFICATTVSGVDRIKISTAGRVKTFYDGALSKCHQTSDGDIYYITHHSFRDFSYNAKYYRKITFTSSTRREDYQINISLNSNNFDFDHTNFDGSDIRIFNADGNEVPHYLESFGAGEMSIWIRPPLWSSYVYMLYGNSSNIYSTSDPEAVFNLFDSFGGDSLDSSKWTVVGNASKFTVAGGSLTCLDGEGDYIMSSGTINFPAIIEQQVYKNSGDTDQINYVNTLLPYEDGLYWYKGSAIARKVLFNGASIPKPTNATFPDNYTYLLNTTISYNKIQMEAWKGDSLIINDVWVGETNGLAARHLKLFGGESPSSSSFKVVLNWVRVRGYDSNNITVAEIGKEKLLHYSKLNVVYNPTTDWTENTLNHIYDGRSDFFPGEVQMNDIFVSEGTTTSGNTIFLATTAGAALIEEKRGDEYNSNVRFYKLR